MHKSRYIYIICSVRNATPRQRLWAKNYVKLLEKMGHAVHYPPRDVDQTDDGVGMAICQMHRKAMALCDEVHVIWDAKSVGSHFDLGMAYAMNKPVIVVNKVKPTESKSYTNVLLKLSEWTMNAGMGQKTQPVEAMR